MATFKNIRVKMKGGKSRTQRVKVLASGKYKFVKNLVKGTKRSRKSKRKSNPKRRTNIMAKRRKKSRRSGRNIVGTTFKFIRIGSLVAPGIAEASKHRGESALDQVAAFFKLYAGVRHGGTEKFDAGAFAEAWTPFLMTSLATYGIPKITGIIRRL